jgi:hypothetical protein
MADGLARYFQQTSREAVLTPISTAFTGSEQIGQAIAQVGQTIDAIAERDEQFWVQKQMADLDGRTSQLWTESVQKATDGAEGFENNYLAALDADYGRMRQSAPSLRAGRMLDLELMRHRNNQASAAQGFAVEEKYQYRRDVIVTEADNLAQEVQRSTAVPAWSPQGYITPPGLPPSAVPSAPGDFYSSGIVQPHTNIELPANLDTWESRYYVPRDFADGANMADRSGPVMVSKRVVSSLDWVTDQFGYGKLQINSGFRTPQSNMARAESGPEGPHTHGEAIDVQVRDLPQAEKNRLYSLFRAAGANAFGFGEGVLHVEWREGTGNGRDGDFEWTYGGAANYERVAVMGPNAATATAATGGQWGGANQYPYLPAVTMTAMSETGSTDFATGSMSVASEADGTTSYGILGLNSGGMMPAFVGEYGAKFGLTAPAGSPEFRAQWEAAVQSDPGGIVQAQLEFHEKHIMLPAQRAIATNGAPAVANDPRAMAFAADLIVQYGAAGAQRHLEAGAGAQDVTTFINAVGESTKRTIDSDFGTALARDPSQRAGLMNRIDQRARDAMAMGTGMGTAITGNVPAWNGPVPNIEDIPGYSDRLARLDTMVDTMGGTPDQRRDLKREMRGQMVRSWLSSVAQTNPSAAMSALMSGRYDDALEAADSAALIGATQTSYRQIESEIRQSQKELMETLKIEAQTALADEVSSVASTGQSLGRLTEAHMAVLTPAEKEQLSDARFQYDIGREIASAKNSELPAILESLRPEGEGFAREQARYDYAQAAVQKHLEAQAADPAAYILSTYPQLQQRWNAALVNNDRAAVASTLQAMLSTQRDIGIANPQLLPSAYATNRATAFNNAELPEQERIDALMGTIAMGTSDEQQRLIFDQMVAAGVPEYAEAAVEASMRGDHGASRRLFQAAMLEPDKLPGRIAEQTSMIGEEVQSQLFDIGRVGDLYYGISDGDASNMAQAQRDGALITKAVQLRLVAGDDLGTAVQKVGRDMFGDVKAVGGNWDVNAQLLLPTDTDPAPILSGLAALTDQVRAAVTPTVPDDVKASDGGRAISTAVFGNYADQVLAEGYFRSVNGGYVFIDPFVGQAVARPDGKPMIFTDDQVMTASRRAAAQQNEAQSRAPAPDSLTMQEREALENAPSDGGWF